MRTLRNKVSLIFGLSLILLIAMVIGLVAPNFLSGGRNLTTAAAVVDGRGVDAQRYSQLLSSRLEARRRDLGADLNDAQALAVRRDTLNNLIDQELTLEHAADLGAAMSDDEFRQDLVQDPSLQDGHGHFDSQRYQQFLAMQAQQGVPWQDVEDNLKRSLLLSKVHAFWAAQAVLTPAEQAAATARFERRLKAKAAVWDLETLRKGLRLSDDDVATYYSLHKGDWEKAPKVKLRQILVRAGFDAASATARAKADAVEARLKAGADFAKLAATENSDDAARSNGGELGWVAKDDLRHRDVANAAFSLAKGAFSPVIPTTEGFVILKVEDRQAGFEPTFANSRARAVEELGRERASAQAREDAARVLADVKAGKTLEAALKGSSARLAVSDWFGRDTAQPFPGLAKDPDLAHNLVALDPGETLPAPYTSTTAVAVVEVSDAKPGAAPSKPAEAAVLEEDARRDALARKAQALEDAWLAGLRAKAKIVDQSGVLAAADR